MDAEQPARPFLRIVHGSPDATEVAALVTVLLASAEGPRPARRSRPAWASHERALASTSLRPSAGHGGWRASALPR